MKFATAAVAFTALTFPFWAAGQVMAQEPTTCLTPGSVVFEDFPSSRGDIVPSVHRQLSGIGRAAQLNGCKIEIICVRDPRAEDPRKDADRMCNAARQATARFENRSTQRREIEKAYKVSKRDPGGRWIPREVHLTLS